MNSQKQTAKKSHFLRNFVVFSALVLCFLFSDAQAAKLFRMQSGTVTLSGTTTTVTIIPVTMSKTFMVFSVTANSDNLGDLNSNLLVGGEVTNSTTLTFSRTTSTSNAMISWQIFEFVSGVTVQHGSTLSVGNTTNVAVAAVDLTKTFVITSGQNTTTDFGSNDTYTANLTSTTNLQLTCTATGFAKAFWQVVQYNESVVKKVTASMSDPTLTTTSTISPAVSNLAKALVIGNHTISGVTSIRGEALPQTVLTNTTTVTYSRSVTNASASFNFVTYVIEFTDNTTVATGIANFAASEVSKDVAVTASLTSTGFFGPGNFGRQIGTNAANENLGYSWCTYRITASNNLNIVRSAGATYTGTAPWQLATFENQVNTYYSFASGAWESNTSWSLSSTGATGPLSVGEFPSRVDNVVIRGGHTITVNNTADNYYPGVKPDNLFKANIGPFAASNLAMFYQTGDVQINGTLNVTGIEAMLGGYTKIGPTGALNLGSVIVNTGFLEAQAGSTFSALDDFILTGNSITIINTSSTSADDIIIDHMDATLCGTGTTTLQNGSGSQITYANGGTLNQVCTSFTVQCTGTGCTGFPAVGTTVVILGNTGPAGVGATDGNSALKLWFRPDNGLAMTGTSVDSWTNSAGIAATNISETGTQRPTYVANAINGIADLSFSGTNRLRTGLTLTTSNFVVDQASSFVVSSAGNTSQQSGVYTTDPLGTNRFSNHIPWANTVYFDIGNCCGNDARLDVGGLTVTSPSLFSYTADPTTGKDLYQNGNLLLSRPQTSVYNSHASQMFNLGGNTGGVDGFVGSIAEVIIYNSKVNTAQRILIDNYMAAKYGLALGTNDVYTRDGSGYDYDVAGIGQASDGSYQKDSQGSGVVRMWNPLDLNSGEFLIWGHNSSPLLTTTRTIGTSVDGTVIAERLVRVWSVSEFGGDVGNVRISFDFSAFPGSPRGSNLRLLIDRDHDGFADNDVTPIAGSASGNTVVFSGVNLQDGDFFTLGTTDVNFGLPIRLAFFEAIARKTSVLTKWKTQTETNNDFFEVFRSADAEQWQQIVRVAGAGTSLNPHDYDFEDKNPLTGVSYYRLRQTDFDGKFSYSPVAVVRFEGNSEWTVSPNPSTGVFTIHHNGNKPVNLVLVNILDQSMAVPFSQNEKETTFDVSGFPAGVYLLKIFDSYSLKTVRLIKE